MSSIMIEEHLASGSPDSLRGSRSDRVRVGFLALGVALLLGCALVPVDERFSRRAALRTFSSSHPPYAEGEIKFSHDLHELVAECVDCHQEEAPDASSSVLLPAMARCFTCHDGSTAANACETCHEKNRARRKPRFHVGSWPRRHKTMAEDEAYKCALCHEEDHCQGCHSLRKPISHTARFARSTHGRMATNNRNSCATCHRSSFCENCHSQPPPDHTPLFMGIVAPDGSVRAGHKQAGLLRGRSCLTCHSFETSCRRCHG